jgi:hypothetical protein
MNDIIPQPRANRHGSKCPDWCHIDHAKVNMYTDSVIDTHISAAMGDDMLWPRVDLTQHSGEFGDNPPQVHVVNRGFVFVDPESAADLADLVESLADCTPQRLRDLADEIRVAASVLR